MALLPAPGAAAAPKPAALYVSLGDSYATGFQPGQVSSRDGFAYQVPALARARGHALRLVNFGCGGETTASLLRRTTPCRAPALGGPSYAGRTQMAAAERFLRTHRRRVALVTVSIGGNDVTACVAQPEPIPCVARAVEAIRANVRTIATRVRRAAGPKALVVGTTYPDVVLGDVLSPDQARRELAPLSVVAFRALINPALERAYAAGRGRFVDVTAATGAYGSMDEAVELAPHGLVPKPVAEVCRLTWYCEKGDIHARRSGYEVIARLVARQLPRRPTAR